MLTPAFSYQRHWCIRPAVTSGPVWQLRAVQGSLCAPSASGRTRCTVGVLRLHCIAASFSASSICRLTVYLGHGQRGADSAVRAENSCPGVASLCPARQSSCLALLLPPVTNAVLSGASIALHRSVAFCVFGKQDRDLSKRENWHVCRWKRYPLRLFNTGLR
ncbi:uncharacterized protein LOC144104356 [Amblyomma americanum]